MKICFVDRTEFQYDYNSKYSPILRGAETALINLSEALSNLGHKITIINNCKENKFINNVEWSNINYISKINKFDVVIANGDCRLFNYAKADNYILFSHSIQNLEKFLRKKQIFSYLKYKPKICFLGEYHKESWSKFLKIFGSIKLNWAVDDIFINSLLNENMETKQAIFTSKFDRNGELLVKIWNEYIQPKNKNLKLLITPSTNKNENPNIIDRHIGSQKNMLKDLLNSRVLLIPGHKAELFCLAAEEGRELCIPIVTMGIGSLKERVIHEKTGFIAKDNFEFANYTLELFNNNNLWFKIRNNLLKKRGKSNWEKIAKKFIEQI